MTFQYRRLDASYKNNRHTEQRRNIVGRGNPAARVALTGAEMAPQQKIMTRKTNNSGPKHPARIFKRYVIGLTLTLGLVAHTFAVGSSLQEALESPDFLDNLEDFLKKENDAVLVLPALAESGDLLGMARWCAVTTHKRYKLLRPQEGIAYCRQLAEQGVPVGMFLYARAYRKGRGVEKNNNEALRWYRQAAKMGNSLAMDDLGWMYEHGRGVEKDYHEALRWYRRAADRNDTWAQVSLGTMYEYERGVKKDYHEALRWYRRAAEGGDARGMLYLGYMDQDDAEAVRWYRRAAEKNSPTGMLSLGYMYAEGRGVKRDDAEAVRWYRQAAEKNDPRGMFYLGYMYEKGRGVKQDDAEAARWYRQAENSDPDGMNDLGLMYREGRGGLPRNIYKAISWYTKAADKGDDFAKEKLAWFGVRYPRGDLQNNLKSWAIGLLGQMTLMLLATYAFFFVFPMKSATASGAPQRPPPDDIHAAGATPEGAKALLFALLLADGDSRTRQLAILRKEADQGLAGHADRLARKLDTLDRHRRVPIIDLIIPWLKQNDPAERDHLLALITKLIKARSRASIEGFVLLILCQRYLGRADQASWAVKYSTLVAAASYVVVLVSLFVHLGKTGADTFDRAMKALGLTGQNLLPSTDLGIERVEAAVHELSQLAPPLKAPLVNACFHIASIDGQLSLAEEELIRALCAVINCPLPPELKPA